MEAKSLTKKRRKYNEKIKQVKTCLNEYYSNKELSDLLYKDNFTVACYPFLQKIYNSYYDMYEQNPALFNNNVDERDAHIAKKVIHRLEYMLRGYKKRVKEIDKLLYY